MELSETGLKMIMKEEGFVPHPYQDVVGVWTIGYGTTTINGVPVNKNTPNITIERALELMKYQIKKTYGASVNRDITVALSQNQYDACVSFAYNLGSMRGLAILINNSKIAKKDWLSYCRGWNRQTKKLTILPALVARRKREWELFNNKL
jgi:lysozyme